MAYAHLVGPMLRLVPQQAQHGYHAQKRRLAHHRFQQRAEQEPVAVMRCRTCVHVHGRAGARQMVHLRLQQPVLPFDQRSGQRVAATCVP